MYQLRANQGICPETPSGLVFVPGQSVRAASPIGFVDVPQELTQHRLLSSLSKSQSWQPTPGYTKH